MRVVTYVIMSLFLYLMQIGEKLFIIKCLFIKYICDIIWQDWNLIMDNFYIIKRSEMQA